MPYVFTRLGSGLNLKAPATAINDADLQEAENARYDVLGAVKSRRGRALVSEIAEGINSTINGHGEFIESDGTVNRITKAGLTVYENEVPIYTVGNAQDISVISYNGYAYITDGFIQKRYDGSGPGGVKPWGIDAPTSGLSADSTATTGGTMIAGTYKYAVTFYNDRCESNLYPDYDTAGVSKVVPAGTSTNTVTLTIPTPPSGSSATGRRIYRTVPGGSAFFELKDIADITTVSYTDGAGDLPDADADSTPSDTLTDEVRAQPLDFGSRTTGRRASGFAAIAAARAAETAAQQIAAGDNAQRTMTNLGVLSNWTDHNAPPADLKNLRMLNGQIFGTSGNSIRWSRTFEPEHWPEFNEVPIGRQGGETLLTIEPFGDNAMACYTSSGLYLFEQLGISAQDARLRQIPTPVGCWGAGAVTRLENGAHLFGGGDAIYLFDGERVQEVSMAVDGLFVDTTLDDHFTASKRSSVVAGSFRDKAYFAYSTHPTDSDNNRNNRLLFVDFEDVSAPKFSVHRGKFSTLQRMEYDNTLVGGTYSGNLVTMDIGLVDEDQNAEDFLFEVRTKEFAFEEGESLVKRIEHVVVDCDTGGGDATIEVRTILDGKAQTATKTARTSGRERVKFRVPPKTQGHTVSVKFSRRAAKERTIYGVGFEYEVAGGV